MKRFLPVIGFSILIFSIAFLLGISLGAVPVPVRDIWRVFWGHEPIGTSEMILLSVRIPRVLLSAIVGASLATAGVLFQALLRNPLAEPYILGISSGAAVGAMISLSFGLSALGTPLAAFLGATLTIFVVYRMGLRKGQLETHTLILAGVVVGAFFSALIMCLVVLSIDPYQNITFWLMGNLSNAHPEIIKKIFPVSLLSVSIAFLLSRRLNILVMGEEHALQLGLPVENFKRLIFVLGSLLTAISVSYTGIIGFVGLIIPHMIRLIWGPDHRLLIPASIFLGASFLVLADLVARTVFAPLEIPVGIVTAFLGAPFFLYLLKKQKNYFV